MVAFDYLTAEKRRHEVISYNPLRDGHSTITLICPFCGAKIIAYPWSMAGNGKRCTCGAMHRTIYSYKNQED